MSFFDDYVADGLCCQSCGVLLDMIEPGHPRWCEGCAPDDTPSVLIVPEVDEVSAEDLETDG